MQKLADYMAEEEKDKLDAFLNDDGTTKDGKGDGAGEGEGDGDGDDKGKEEPPISSRKSKEYSPLPKRIKIKEP